MATLFSSPEQLQQAQWQAALQQANQYGQMTPEARVGSGAFFAGNQLGNAVSSMLGAQDPELAKVRDIQSLVKGVDLNDADSLTKLSKALSERGYVEEADLAAKKAQEAKKNAAEIGLKNAQRDKALRDPSFRSYEYEQMMEILNDPEATEEQKKLAQARIDALNAKSSKAGGGNSGTGQLVAGADGFMYRVDKGTGVSTPVLNNDGTPLAAAAYNAGLQGTIAAAKAGSTAMAKGNADAQLALPKMRYQAEVSNIHLDELLSHPGFNSSVGATLKPGAKLIQGSPEASFKSRFDQIKGEAFNQAYESLRGGGSITEVETKKAGDAINRMNTADSEAEFRAAAEDFRRAVKAGLKIMEEKANMKFSNPNTPSPAPTPVPSPKPTSTVQRSAPFSGVTTPAQVRDLYRQGKLTKADANAILDEMKNQGLF